MSHFSNTHIIVSDEPDEDMVRTKVEVLEMSRADWELICAALNSTEFWHVREAKSLIKDIRSEILANLRADR